MPQIRWELYPTAERDADARAWLTLEADSDLSATTVAAYSRAVEGYLAYCADRRIGVRSAAREHVAAYLAELSGLGLAPPTLRQRLAAIRLFYDFLVDRGEREDNPAAGGGLARSRGGAAGAGEADLSEQPWLPDDEQWLRVLAAARGGMPRSRLMLALAYDAALRREEVCGLSTTDLDLDRHTVRVQPATVATRRGREVPYSDTLDGLYSAYLEERRLLSREPGPLFLSESRRNRAQPISIWTWSKVVRSIAERARVEGFSPHTPRHLRLTDMARDGHGPAEIAQFAGLAGVRTTLRYSELAAATRWRAGAEGAHDARVAQIAELLA